MTDVEQKVRAQAEEWGAEVVVRPAYARINGKHSISIYAEPGTRFAATALIPGLKHTLSAYGDTEEEVWASLFKAMQYGIEDCPRNCECRDD